MNLKTFQHILDCYSTNTNLWPLKIRVEALAFLEESKEAQELYRVEQIFDNTLHQVDIPAPAVNLQQRILEMSYSTPQRSGSLLNWLKHISISHALVPTAVAVFAFAAILPTMNTNHSDNWESQLQEAVELEEQANTDSYAIDLFDEQTLNPVLDELIQSQEEEEIYNML